MEMAHGSVTHPSLTGNYLKVEAYFEVELKCTGPRLSGTAWSLRLFTIYVFEMRATRGRPMQKFI